MKKRSGSSDGGANQPVAKRPRHSSSCCPRGRCSGSAGAERPCGRVDRGERSLRSPTQAVTSHPRGAPNNSVGCTPRCSSTRCGAAGVGGWSRRGRRAASACPQPPAGALGPGGHAVRVRSRASRGCLALGRHPGGVPRRALGRVRSAACSSASPARTDRGGTSSAGPRPAPTTWPPATTHFCRWTPGARGHATASAWRSPPRGGPASLSAPRRRGRGRARLDGESPGRLRLAACRRRSDAAVRDRAAARRASASAVARVAGNGTCVLKSIPSGGARHPTEVFLAAFDPTESRRVFTTTRSSATGSSASARGSSGMPSRGRPSTSS